MDLSFWKACSSLDSRVYDELTTFGVQYRLLVDAIHLVYEELTTFSVQYRLLVDVVHLV